MAMSDLCLAQDLAMPNLPYHQTQQQSLPPSVLTQTHKIPKQITISKLQIGEHLLLKKFTNSQYYNTKLVALHKKIRKIRIKKTQTSVGI